MKKIYILLIASFIGMQFLTAQPTTVGSETPINTTTAGSQENVAIAMDATGDYVVVWESFGQDVAGTYGIYARVYNSAGVAQTGETLVNTTTAGDQRFPDVAMDDAGNFVVTWMSFDADNWGIFAQRFTAAGASAGGQISVNTTTANNQKQPRVAMDSDGDFVIVWTDELKDGNDFGIYFQRYNSGGTPQGSETLANTTVAGYQGYPCITINPSGNFVIAWQSPDADGHGIFAQRFNSAGTKQGTEISVNTTTAGSQIEPDITMNSNGEFIIVWSSFGQDGDNEGVYLRAYNSSGVASGSETKVNTTTTNAQTRPSVTNSTPNGYIVCWSSAAQDGSFMGVYLQGYSYLGGTSGGELLVNTRTTDFQHNADIVMSNSSERAIVVWQDGLRNSTATQDGSDYGVYAQTFDIADVLPVELISFHGRLIDGRGSLLEWHTTSEQNNKGFEIQRTNMPTSNNWETLDFIRGNGTTSEIQNYSYIDYQPLKGINYYRLKQIDFSDNYEYSNIISIQNEEAINNKLSIYPNPTTDQITISGQLGIATFYNMLGQSLDTFILTKNNTQISMTDLPQGQYFLEILTTDGQKLVKKVVKH